jgi:glycosyltransferase involved in cell wall biosynthesis
MVRGSWPGDLEYGRLAGRRNECAADGAAAARSMPGLALCPVPPAAVTLPPPTLPIHQRMAARADQSGISRIHVFAFRDRDDPEAGGSEEHASQVCRHLALAGREVVLHTGRAPGHPTEIERDGFRVVRRGGRMGVFATSVYDEHRGRLGRADGIVEIFHGVPFFAPLWSRRPQVGVVHHVHLGTWDLLLPGPLGRVGHAVERFLVPVVYRRRALVTAAPSARDEIVAHYRADPSRIAIAPHGIDERFSPGGRRSAVPLVVAVARLMPQKGVDELIDAMVEVRHKVPDVEATIVGDGPHRARLEAKAAGVGAGGWLRFAGRVDDDALVDWYRSAWVVASASRREGFGLTLTEAAACGTPVVASRIPGHVDAVADGHSGLLAESTEDLAEKLARVLIDRSFRRHLAQGALSHAARFRWDESAATLLEALCDEADRRR